MCVCVYVWQVPVLISFPLLSHFKWITVRDDYFKFCREVFENTRTPPIPGSRYTHHCWVYEPLKFRSEVSELFRATTASTSASPGTPAFTPQLVPVDFSRPFLRQLLSTNAYPAVLLNQLPHSLKLILQIGADLLGVAMMDLYEALVAVEKRLVFWPLKECAQLNKTTVLDAFEMTVQFSRTLLNTDDDSEPHPPANDSNPTSPL